LKTPIKKTKVVNFYAGPGTGKSAMCAGVFAWLKSNHVDCEMALEYIKDEVWEENQTIFKNQISIFGNQHRRIFRLLGKVDVVLTDCPLLMGIAYDTDNNTHLRNLIEHEVSKMDNINYFLQRGVSKYNPNGRKQKTVAAAKKLDKQILGVLKQYHQSYEIYNVSQWDQKAIAADIVSKLKSNDNI